MPLATKTRLCYSGSHCLTQPDGSQHTLTFCSGLYRVKKGCRQYALSAGSLSMCRAAELPQQHVFLVRTHPLVFPVLQ